MKIADIPLIRLGSQHIGGKEFTTAGALIAWLGAMQAQDFPMAKWAIGLRLPGSRLNLIESAIDKGEILRTHLLRPTWHFVSTQDIYWLLDLTAPNIKNGQKSRDRDLELTHEVYALSNRTIEKALGASGQLSREQLIVELNNAGIATDQNRASHLLMRAELEKIICSGASLRNKPMYALLAERVPKPRLLSKEEALAELARRYFTSRSPVTLQDFMWWSGLPAGDARQALEMIKPAFSSQALDGHEFWFYRDVSTPDLHSPSAYLLPVFDEFIVSYADRSATIPPSLEQHMKEISDNGVFRPIIVVNGIVVGIWKRTLKKDTMQVEIRMFSRQSTRVLPKIEQAASEFASFWGTKLDLSGI